MGIPGLQRLDHIGFTVPDLDEAHRFLVDVLGCEYLYTLGPFEPDGDWMSAHLNVHPVTRMENRWFRCGDQAVFEVFAYDAPDQRDAVPKNSDVGGHHVALYVDDLDAAVTYLKDEGVRVCEGPDRQPGPGPRQSLDLLHGAVGDAVRAGLLPGRQGLGPRARGGLSP